MPIKKRPTVSKTRRAKRIGKRKVSTLTKIKISRGLKRNKLGKMNIKYKTPHRSLKRRVRKKMLV